VDPGTIAPPSTGAPDLTAAEVASAREAWLAAGLPAEQIDAALRADGHDPNAAPSEDTVEHHGAFDLPIAPQPNDYSPRYADPVAIRPESHLEIRQFAADMGFSPIIGNAVIERLSEIGAGWRNMGDTERQLYLAEQRAISSRQFGDDGAVTEMQERAANVLRELGGKLGAHLAGHPAVLADPYLLLAISSHADQIAQFAALHPADRGK
jgi:hypothetical protein